MKRIFSLSFQTRSCSRISRKLGKGKSSQKKGLPPCLHIVNENTLRSLKDLKRKGSINKINNPKGQLKFNFKTFFLYLKNINYCKNSEGFQQIYCCRNLIDFILQNFAESENGNLHNSLQSF